MNLLAWLFWIGLLGLLLLGLGILLREVNLFLDKLDRKHESE